MAVRKTRKPAHAAHALARVVGAPFLALIADKALKRAAEAEGLPVVNPEDDNARQSILS